jgi:hypothetical protein
MKIAESLALHAATRSGDSRSVAPDAHPAGRETAALEGPIVESAFLAVCLQRRSP